MKTPLIIILCGGESEEQAVSRRSGANVRKALRGSHRCQLIDMAENKLPRELNPERHVIFPALHGAFGEDGELQRILENQGFEYAGSGPSVSALCMNKVDAKKRVAALGVNVIDEWVFKQENLPQAASIMQRLGDNIVIKPVDKGSSVGLYLARGSNEINDALSRVREGLWMAERLVSGRELTVGVLNGQGMGVVEIRPKQGPYDYHNKYTEGATDYLFPADLPEETTEHVRRTAEITFAACGCRDFARVDFILAEDGTLYFLEINTIPGLTATSLLPKSAHCIGYDFPALIRRMVAPALARFQSRNHALAAER